MAESLQPATDCFEETATKYCSRPRPDDGLVVIADFETAAALRNPPQCQFIRLGLGASLKHPIDHHAVEMHMRIGQGTEGILAGSSRPAGLALTVSLGVATRQAGESLEALFRRADSAVYRAKQKGLNRVEIDD